MNQRDLNHWAFQLFSSWNQAGKSCTLPETKLERVAFYLMTLDLPKQKF